MPENLIEYVATPIVGGAERIRGSWPGGWRASIGLIIPSVDQGTTLYEHLAIAPVGVTIAPTKMPLPGTITAESLTEMGRDAMEYAGWLKSAKVDVISYTCTSGALVKGIAYDKKIISDIATAGGNIPATSMANAVVEALRFMVVKRILLVAPYTNAITALEKKYFQDNGFEITADYSLNILEASDIFDRSPWRNYRFALECWKKSPDCDAIFMSCGAFRTLEIIDYLEKATGKPVFSSNQCNMWHCLRLAGIYEPVRGFGKFLEKPRNP